jgi:hypothetical protein
MTVPPFFMIKPLILFIAAVCFAISVQSQQTVADSIPINKDSLEREIDEFLKLFDSLQQPKSYVLIGLGISNQQFSAGNTGLNAQQSNTSFNLVPTLAYFHKSGFGITYNPYIALSNMGSKLFQHTVTPSYTYEKGKLFEWGATYTRYIGNKSFKEFTSPYKNDLFAYAEYKKWKFKPFLSAGFANGKINETTIIDTFAVIKRQVRPDTTVFFKQFDTLNIKLRDYSFIAGLKRDYTFNGFSKKDYITFSPSFMLFFGVSDYDIEYISQSKITPQLINYFKLYPRQARDFVQQFPVVGRSRNLNSPGSFNLQSLALNLDATWYIGKFYFNPQFYFDYYLLSSSNKFNVLYSVQAGFMF